MNMGEHGVGERERGVGTLKDPVDVSGGIVMVVVGSHTVNTSSKGNPFIARLEAGRDNALDD